MEEMDGRWLGLEKGDHLETMQKLFRKRFKKSDGALIEGVGENSRILVHSSTVRTDLASYLRFLASCSCLLCNPHLS